MRQKWQDIPTSRRARPRDQKGAAESVHNEGDLIYELGYENEVGIISV